MVCNDFAARKTQLATDERVNVVTLRRPCSMASLHRKVQPLAYFSMPGK